LPLRPFLEDEMAVWCNYDELVTAIRTAAALTKKVKNLPAIHGRVLLDAKEGRLEVVGTDLEVRAGTYIEAECRDEGELADEILVQADALLGVLRAMPKTAIVGLNLTTDGHLQIGSRQDLFAKIPVFDAEQWPAYVKVPETAREYGVDVDFLRLGIEHTEFAAARPSDVGRDFLRGLTIRDGNVVASNGKRIAIYKLGAAYDLGVTFPFAAVPALLKILPHEEEYISIFHDERGPRVWFLATTGYVTACSNPVALPDYEKLLPDKFQAEVRVDVAELKSAIEIAVACQAGETKKADQVVELAVDGGGLLVTDPKRTWHTSVGDLLRWEGRKQYRAVFSVPYVLQALKAARRYKYLKISFSNPKGAALATAGDWRYAFMPTIRK
jgi:DNA polymerase-3 subunit beta